MNGPQDCLLGVSKVELGPRAPSPGVSLASLDSAAADWPTPQAPLICPIKRLLSTSRVHTRMAFDESAVTPGCSPAALLFQPIPPPGPGDQTPGLEPGPLRQLPSEKKSHSCQLPALGRHTIQSNLQTRSFPQTPKTTELSTARHFSDPMLNAFKTA